MSSEIHRVGDIPPRFEDEYPEEAEIMYKLCANKELRDAVIALEAKYPKSERIYQHVNPLRAYMKNMFRSSKTPYVRSDVKVGRNDPCPCGSGKKYKKCCIIEA